MLKLFNKIIDKKITPNGFYFLLTIKENEDVRLNNIEGEIQSLLNAGFLTPEGITEKGEEIISLITNFTKTTKYVLTQEDKENIEKYRNIFPKGNLPSGYPARVPNKELEKRFIWFLSTYDYEWDTILKATKKYVEQYEPEGYKYMKTSSYFIYKSDVDKNVVSTLASYCDMILDSTDDINPESYSSAL